MKENAAIPCCICSPRTCEGQDESGEHGCMYALGVAKSCCMSDVKVVDSLPATAVESLP